MIDSHAHLDSPAFDSDRDAVIQRAFDSAVERIVQIGGRPDRWQTSAAVADRAPGRIRVIVGLCPHDSPAFDADLVDSLRQFIQTRADIVAGIGEIGLEYFYDIPKDIQQAAFRAQLRLAGELQLPIAVHTREAEADTLRLLNEEADTRGAPLSGLIHCFTGGPDFAERCIALGLDISFSGIVTFANAGPIADAAVSVPLDRIHIETDSPYLVPRNAGLKTRRCEPSFVRYTGEFIAQRRGLESDAFIASCAANTRRRFFPADTGAGI